MRKDNTPLALSSPLEDRARLDRDLALFGWWC